MTNFNITEAALYWNLWCTTGGLGGAVHDR